MTEFKGKTRKGRPTDPSTVEKAKDIADAYNSGENTGLIASRFQIAQPNIYHYLRVAGVKPSRLTKDGFKKEMES